MIAVHAPRCGDYVYPALTPVNIMRTVFACLAEDPALMTRRAADISLFGAIKNQLSLATQDGRMLAAWQPYSPKQ
jgi:hypothetical protein